MLGKLRLKPSFLLDAAFILVVWLSAQLIFHASLTVIIVVIFCAYALVFLYEHWFHGLARRERLELRRSKHEVAADYVWPGPTERPLSPVVSGAVEAGTGESEIPTERFLQRPAAEPPGSVADRGDALPPEVIAAEAAHAREQAEREQAEQERAERKSAEREQAEREAGEPVVAEKPIEPEAEAPQERRSLMAEIAAAPGATLRTHAVGGWNIWQLERMMAARTQRDEQRDYERSLLLVYLREFADSDGQLPPDFDELVHESFGDLVRGPVIP